MVGKVRPPSPLITIVINIFENVENDVIDISGNVDNDVINISADGDGDRCGDVAWGRGRGMGTTKQPRKPVGGGPRLAGDPLLGPASGRRREAPEVRAGSREESCSLNFCRFGPHPS